VDGHPDAGAGRRAVLADDGAVLCSCGDRLADRIDGWNVVIDGVEFQFRRRNDVMTCRSCGHDHPVRDLWATSERAPESPADTGQRRRRDD
jgi:hypothetical protein